MTKFFGVRFMDNVAGPVRETCDRYGTQVIGKMLSEGFKPATPDLQEIYKADNSKLDARDWLTETTDIQDYRERWIPLRDLVLEIFVIALIGIEIGFSWHGERQQSKNFNDEQQLLKDLSANTKTTADNLSNLSTATKDLNDLMRNELEQNARSARASERSAKASEASSKTAIDALQVSERASLVGSAQLDSDLKAGEIPQFTVIFRNAGKTNASQVTVTSRNLALPAGTNLQKVHDSSLRAYGETKSMSVVGAGDSLEQKWKAGKILTEPELNLIKNDAYRLYVFSDATYKDEFGVTHHAHFCALYDVRVSRLVHCPELNSTD